MISAQLLFATLLAANLGFGVAGAVEPKLAPAVTATITTLETIVRLPVQTIVAREDIGADIDGAVTTAKGLLTSDLPADLGGAATAVGGFLTSVLPSAVTNLVPQATRLIGDAQNTAEDAAHSAQKWIDSDTNGVSNKLILGLSIGGGAMGLIAAVTLCCFCCRRRRTSYSSVPKAVAPGQEPLLSERYEPYKGSH
ncbi:hypothetical protein GQ53DRAFT_811479 [Thozetella sp. PMI_491]|nr:hypothetical protein GQ53DRAFT_811479 [Thozetella sp. PMI_491]